MWPWGTSTHPSPWGRHGALLRRPLAYSVTESRRAKTATVVELGGQRGEVRLNELPLSPLRPVRRLKGPLEALCRAPSAAAITFTPC